VIDGAAAHVGAVWVGAFLLAEAGLRNQRRATTHWRFGREMATRFPGVRVQYDPLWVKDGKESRGKIPGETCNSVLHEVSLGHRSVGRT